MTRLSVVGIVAAVLVVAGCLVTREDYTINPDGSGKVTFEISGFVKSSDLGRDAALRRYVEDILDGSGGVDAWADLECAVRDDGDAWFRGTAYFRDVTNLRFPIAEKAPFRPYPSREPNGDLVLSISRYKPNRPASEFRRPLGDGLEDRIRSVRTEYMASSDPIHRLFGIPTGSGLFALKNTTQSFVLRLPGRVQEITNLQKAEDGSFGVTLDGEKFVQVMGDLVKDDAAMRPVVLAGENPLSGGPLFDSMVHKKLFGQEGPIKVRMSDERRPLFDYEAEVATARRRYADALREAGLVLGGHAHPAEGPDLKNARVTKIRWDKGIQKFTIEVECEFVADVAALYSGEILAAVGSNEELALPRIRCKRTFQPHFRWWSKRKIGFSVDIPPPAGNASELREISGAIAYSMPPKFADIDLGITTLAPGTEGRLGARLSMLSLNGEVVKTATIYLPLHRDAFQALKFYDEQGHLLRTRKCEWKASNGGGVVACSFRDKVVEGAAVRTVAVADEHFEVYVIGFKLVGIPLPSVATN